MRQSTNNRKVPFHVKKELSCEIRASARNAAAIDSLWGMGYDFSMRESVLLHICCAPDATYPVELLSDGFEVSGYFCNPNIHPPKEHEKRLSETKKFMESMGLRLYVSPCTAARWLEEVKEFEDEPEGGHRCLICYRMRLEETAKFAKRMGFDCFTTTLTISPHKSSKVILSMGREIESKYGVRFLSFDFKKKGGFTKSVKASTEAGLYRQDYCGCAYSLKDRIRGKREGLVRLLEDMRECRQCRHLWKKKLLPCGDAGSRLMIVGQAPGKAELKTDLPFSGPAGRRLFSWMEHIGVPEDEFRTLSYITAIVKCYPGHIRGGKKDLAPSTSQRRKCARFLEGEIRLLRPDLIVPVGRAALDAILGGTALSDAVGKKWRRPIWGHLCDIIPLPHPSGASPWVYRNRRLHQKALRLLRRELGKMSHE